MRTLDGHKETPLGVSEQNHLVQKSTYQVDGKMFIVEPVFKPDAKETVGMILVNLMRTDVSQG